MSHVMFQQAFTETIKAFTTNQTLPDELWSDIAFHYSGNGRHYHSLHHLDSITRELSGVKGAINDWDVVVLAIAYHDIIYDPLKADNEERSAAFAREKLSGILPPERLQQCTYLILATQSHAVSNDPDVVYFTDADLAVLGAEPAAYQLYTAQIRREYSYYPDHIYKPGRQKVLRHFLDMPRLYKSEEFYQKYEMKARFNLSEEIRGLST